MIQSVKAFKFDREHYSRVTISDTDKIRLNTRENRIQLKAQSVHRPTGRNVYPLDTDLTVSTWVTNPARLAGWFGFYADPCYVNQPAGTSVRYKLNDGTDDRYWGGSSWDVAGAADWNTEAEVAANIDTFPVAPDRKLQVIVNLVTTDPYVTPTVSAMYTGMELDMDGIGDVLLDSLVPSLRSGMEFTARVAVVVDRGGTQISLRDIKTPYDIQSVSAIYNDDQDPDHLTDIFDTYDAANKIATVTSGFAAGEAAFIHMTVRPRVYVNWSSQDYYQVEKIPAVVIDSMRITGNQVWGQAVVKDIANLTAKVQRKPYRLHLELDILLMAEGNRSLMAMITQSLKHSTNTPLLAWRGPDEELTLTMLRESDFRPRPDLRDAHASTYSLRIDDLYLWLDEAQEVPLTNQVVVSLATPELEGGARWMGAH